MPYERLARSTPIQDLEPPMVLGPIYGIRGWYGPFFADARSPLLSPLRSIGVGYCWENPPEPARCRDITVAHPDGECPRSNCSCGYYSHKPGYEHELVSAYMPQIIGVVELAGRVIEHLTGYRSQYAYPRLLIPTIPLPPLWGYEDITEPPMPWKEDAVTRCRDWIAHNVSAAQRE